MSATLERPRYTILGGPNGAGKSTAFARLTVWGYRSGAFLNPDEIAKELDGPELDGPEPARAVAAGRETFAALPGLDGEPQVLRSRVHLVEPRNRSQRTGGKGRRLPGDLDLRRPECGMRNEEPGTGPNPLRRPRHSGAGSGAPLPPLVRQRAAGRLHRGRGLFPGQRLRATPDRGRRPPWDRALPGHGEDRLGRAGDGVPRSGTADVGSRNGAGVGANGRGHERRAARRSRELRSGGRGLGGNRRPAGGPSCGQRQPR